jgi:hypothetical protein
MSEEIQAVVGNVKLALRLLLRVGRHLSLVIPQRSCEDGEQRERERGSQKGGEDEVMWGVVLFAERQRAGGEEDCETRGEESKGYGTERS